MLLSYSTRELVEDDLPASVRLRDLGTDELKDIDRPERIFQLVIDGLPRDFPPLKAARSRRPAAGCDAAGSCSVRWPGVIAAAVAIPLFARGGRLGWLAGSRAVDAKRGRLRRRHVRQRSSRQGPVGATPTHVAVGEGAIWVTNTDGRSVSRIDLVTRAVVQTIPVGASPSGITTGHGAVWVTNSLDGDRLADRPRDEHGGADDPRRATAPSASSTEREQSGSRTPATTTITRIDAASGKPGKTLPIAATELAFGGRNAVGKLADR